MPKHAPTSAQDTPTPERIYVVPNGDASLVVKGWLLAQQKGREVGVNPSRARSVEHAHELLSDLYGHVPTSAKAVTGGRPTFASPPARASAPTSVPPPPPPAPLPVATQSATADSGVVRRSLPWLRIETEDGVIDKTVTDPDQIEGLKDLRLWP